MTNLTTGLVTDCHLFIFIQVRFASAIGKPALIIIRWNFAGCSGISFHCLPCSVQAPPIIDPLHYSFDFHFIVLRDLLQ